MDGVSTDRSNHTNPTPPSSTDPSTQTKQQLNKRNPITDHHPHYNPKPLRTRRG
jgi:hypothetical protein